MCPLRLLIVLQPVVNWRLEEPIFRQIPAAQHRCFWRNMPTLVAHKPVGKNNTRQWKKTASAGGAAVFDLGNTLFCTFMAGKPRCNKTIRRLLHTGCTLGISTIRGRLIWW